MALYVRECCTVVELGAGNDKLCLYGLGSGGGPT